MTLQRAIGSQINIASRLQVLEIIQELDQLAFRLPHLAAQSINQSTELVDSVRYHVNYLCLYLMCTESCLRLGLSKHGLDQRFQMIMQANPTLGIQLLHAGGTHSIDGRIGLDQSSLYRSRPQGIQTIATQHLVSCENIPVLDSNVDQLALVRQRSGISFLPCPLATVAVVRVQRPNILHGGPGLLDHVWQRAGVDHFWITQLSSQCVPATLSRWEQHRHVLVLRSSMHLTGTTQPTLLEIIKHDLGSKGTGHHEAVMLAHALDLGRHETHAVVSFLVQVSGIH